jgi:rod shape-determining protein MreD
VSPAEYKPFAQPLPPGRARAIPWVSVALASTLTALPFIATLPLMPPAGLLMLLAWRLLARFALRPWAAAPLGFWDDLVSGQPLGSAVLLWSLCFLAIELIESRILYRDFWQEWLIAAAAIAFCLAAGRLIAVPWRAELAPLVGVQIGVSVFAFPLAARVAAWIDRRRGPLA